MTLADSQRIGATTTCSASSRLMAIRVPQTEQIKFRPPASLRT
jgi:hypothetical protein